MHQVEEFLIRKGREYRQKREEARIEEISRRVWRCACPSVDLGFAWCVCVCVCVCALSHICFVYGA